MGQTTKQQLDAELLEQLRYIRAHTSRTAELLTTGVRNNTLAVATATIPATGALALSWGAVCGSIRVRNLGDDDIVVASGPASVSPAGVGAWTVPAGVAETVAVYGREVTIYGTAGARLCYQAFTTGAANASAGTLGAVDGGTL